MTKSMERTMKLSETKRIFSQVRSWMMERIGLCRLDRFDVMEPLLGVIMIGEMMCTLCSFYVSEVSYIFSDRYLQSPRSD